MKTFFAIALLLVSSVAQAAQKSEAKLDYDAAYSYLITVTDETGGEYFSIALMNNGALSYEYWSDSEQMDNQEITLSADQAKAFSTKFADAFTAVSKASDKGSGPSVSLEKIDARKSTTYTAVGSIPAVKALLDMAQPKISGKYPVAY
ncbi:hypothetical protein [Cerasicoccus frondis]|uniref:hypothetical protein n=1 Tax=Cerasicoccus frondis TaxID=490090 RepID=UPI0028526EAC|nr:hypothetical protein [Cerasicoccus frondis]